MESSEEIKTEGITNPEQDNLDVTPGKVPETFDLNFIVERAKEVSLNPETPWAKLRAEEATPKSMYLGYIVYLTAIPVIFQFLGYLFSGFFFSALILSITTYLLSLVMIGATAFIAEKVANSMFKGNANLTSTLKLYAYSATPIWLLGVFNIVPVLSGLIGIVAALYALYLFYKGIPEMTGVLPEKRIPFLLVMLVATIVVGLIIGLLATPFAIAGALG